mgnify:CR=1 FL=1
MKDNFDIFFRRKPALMLVALKKVSKARYGSVLAKEVDCTYSHAVKILQEMETAKLVEFEKNGRIKTIKLTDTGHNVAQHIEKIREIL